MFSNQESSPKKRIEAYPGLASILSYLSNCVPEQLVRFLSKTLPADLPPEDVYVNPLTGV